MVLVATAFVPVHAPDPVSDKNAVKLPEFTLGVNVASAGSAFCAHDPIVSPPDQAWLLYVPDDEAPVIRKEAFGVRSHLLNGTPAIATGV